MSRTILLIVIALAGIGCTSNQQTLYGNQSGQLIVAADYAGAARVANVEISRDPDNWTAHCNRACALAAMGRFTEALADARTATQIAPLEPLPHISLGFISFCMGDYRSARPELQSFIQTAPPTSAQAVQTAQWMLSECAIAETLLDMPPTAEQEIVRQAMEGHAVLCLLHTNIPTQGQEMRYRQVVYYPRIRFQQMLDIERVYVEEYLRSKGASDVEVRLSATSPMYMIRQSGSYGPGAITSTLTGTIDRANLVERSVGNSQISFSGFSVNMTITEVSTFSEVSNGVLKDSAFEIMGTMFPSMLASMKLSAEEYRDFILSKSESGGSPPPSTAPSPGEGLASYGTGWIAMNGAIVTAYHVVKGHDKIRITNSRGERLSATLAHADAVNDIAVLAVSNEGRLPRGLSVSDRAPKLGDKVFTIGYPHVDVMGISPKYTSGVISALAGLRDTPNTFQITVPVQAGSSGGPLLNDRGEVIGLIVSKISAMRMFLITGDLPENVNYAVKSAYFKDLLSGASTATVPRVPRDAGESDIIKCCSEAVCIIVAE